MWSLMNNQTRRAAEKNGLARVLKVRLARPQSPIHIGVLVLVITLLPLGWSAPATARYLKFDHTVCGPQNRGWVYFSMYGIVFRFSVRESIRTKEVPNTDNAGFPEPDNPVAPAGCRGNPMQVKWLSVVLKDPKTGEDSNSVANALAGPPAWWGTQSIYQRSAKLQCGSWRKQEAPGIKLCASFGFDIFGDPANRMGSFVFDKTRYSAPYNLPFVINCHPALWWRRRPRFRQCQYFYKLFGTVAIRARFNLEKNPPAEIQKYDERVRRLFLTAFRPELTKPYTVPWDRKYSRPPPGFHWSQYKYQNPPTDRAKDDK